VRVIAALSCFLLLACSEAGTSASAVRWRKLADVSVRESDTRYVSLPTSMSVDSRGDLFITDAQLGTIWQITRDGILQRSYGALGDGPGEFRRPGHVLVKQDTVFAVNGARRRLIAYDRRSGVLFGEREIPSGVRHLVELTDTLYGATLLAASERVLHRLGGSDLPAAHVTGVPGLLEGREQLRVVFDGAALAQLGDQLFGVFQVSDSLYAWPARPGAAGEPTKPSTELIPVRLRHGSRPELLLRATTDQDAAMEAAYGTSIPLAISGVAGQLRVNRTRFPGGSNL
jgi:hypothetical protein